MSSLSFSPFPSLRSVSTSKLPSRDLFQLVGDEHILSSLTNSKTSSSLFLFKLEADLPSPSSLLPPPSFQVDVDKVQAIAQKYNVRAMPTFLFLKGGQKIDEVSLSGPALSPFVHPRSLADLVHLPLSLSPSLFSSLKEPTSQGSPRRSLDTPVPLLGPSLLPPLAQAPWTVW